jgi:hypothetical protein
VCPTYNASARHPVGASSVLDMSSVLGGSSTPYGSPTAVAHTHAGFNGAASVADPMAAVFANVNRNLTGGQSVLNPWGLPAKEDAQEPTSPSTPSDFGASGLCCSLASFTDPQHP